MNQSITITRRLVPEDQRLARACATHYHRLRQYMIDHIEVAAILRAID